MERRRPVAAPSLFSSDPKPPPVTAAMQKVGSQPDEAFFLNRSPIKMAEVAEYSADLNKGWMWAVHLRELALVIRKLVAENDELRGIGVPIKRRRAS
jgi:hypothetical protein